MAFDERLLLLFKEYFARSFCRGVHLLDNSESKYRKHLRSSFPVVAGSHCLEYRQSDNCPARLSSASSRCRFWTHPPRRTTGKFAKGSPASPLYTHQQGYGNNSPDFHNQNIIIYFSTHLKPVGGIRLIKDLCIKGSICQFVFNKLAVYKRLFYNHACTADIQYSQNFRTYTNK